ncbi:MAG: carbohydrate ABC transporter permease [Lachnospiraceae bacterium]|nr:carbohydrate ABC transporter permease [Lachnospiraceae bacterium]
MKKTKGVLGKAARYVYLFIISFAIIYPILMLISSSFKDLYGLIDPMVRWIPTKIEWQNYVKAFNCIGGIKVMVQSVATIVFISMMQTMISAITAYGFAKARFRGHNLLFGLMLVLFFVPDQVMFIPRYVLYSKYQLVGSWWTVILPASFGQGIRSPLMILLFWLFYRQQPKSLEDAAYIDGASALKTFAKINLPLAKSGFSIVFILSFAFNWNDTYFTSVFFEGKVNTVNLMLKSAKSLYAMTNGGAENTSLDKYYNSAIEAAGVILSIIPLIVLYILSERKMIEAIDKVGISGE